MKFSCISASSIFALLSAAIGPAHAAALTATPGQSNIYDLVHDGVTSSDGGDRTVTSQDPLITARIALEAASGHWQTASFTGPVDLAAQDAGYPTVPLGAAPGARPDEDLASPVIGAERLVGWQKAQVIGHLRVASLIGTVGNGSALDDKTGSTVFVVAGGANGFNDGGEDAGTRSSSVAYAFGPSSTSTATITVAGAGNLARRGSGGGFSAIAANSLRATPNSVSDPTPAVALADAAAPTLGYNYAPANSAAKTTPIAASFSDAVTANGTFAENTDPRTRARTVTSQLQSVTGQLDSPGNGKIVTSQLQSVTGQLDSPGNGKIVTSQLQPRMGQQGQSGIGKTLTSELQSGQGQPGGAGNRKTLTSELQPGQGQPGRAGNRKTLTSELQPSQGRPGEPGNGKMLTSQVQPAQGQPGKFETSEALLFYQKLLDLTQPIQGPRGDTQADGTRAFLSASVSANPSATAALYMANVVNAARAIPTGQTVEAFQIGPTGDPKAQGGPGTTVADPLHGKIMASAGALNNSLALP